VADDFVQAASLFVGPDLSSILAFFSMMTGYRGARAARRLRGRSA